MHRPKQVLNSGIVRCTERPKCFSEVPSKPGNICHRGTRFKPHMWALGEPLAGQGCLPVAGRGDEHDHSRCRLIEKARQPGPLDDVAACPGGLFLEFDHGDRALPALLHSKRNSLRPDVAKAPRLRPEPQARMPSVPRSGWSCPEAL